MSGSPGGRPPPPPDPRGPAGAGAAGSGSDALVPPERLVTPRLVIRRPEPTDARAIYDGWSRDPQVTRYLVWTPHESLQDARDHVARCETSWADRTAFVWILTDRASDEPVGSLAARHTRRGVDFGYLLARRWWGRGLMPEALGAVADWWWEQDGIFRLWATCDVENRASARVLEKVGFELEGTLRRWERHPNLGPEPRDALCWSRVR